MRKKILLAVVGILAALVVVDRAMALTGGRGILFQALFNAGTQNAVDRTAYDKIKDWVSVKDYGATGTGVTNDETAVQQAITNAGGSGLIQFPCPGTYLTTSFGTLDCGIYYPPLAASGAIPRSVPAKLFDTVSIKDFGAKCDGSDDSAAFTNAYAALGSKGGKIFVPCEATISTPITITIVSGKSLILDMGGHSITLAHSSGVGLTINGGLFRNQVFSIQNGTILGSSTNGITGLLLKDVLNGSVRDVFMRSFLGTNQIAMQMDNSQDNTIDNLVIEGASGSGTIALDLTNTANANRFSALQLNDGAQALNIHNGTSGTWISDCLIQQNRATHAVIVSSTGTDPDINNTRFFRCWFEDNGDSTANSSSVYFNTGAGHTISDTTMESNNFNGGSHGNLGVIWRLSATGTPGAIFNSRANYMANYASVWAGAPNGSYGVVSINDGDRTGTMTATASLAYPGINKGIAFAPAGGSKKYYIYAGAPSDNDGKLEFYNLTDNLEIMRYGGTWIFPRDINMSGARVTFARVTPTYSAGTTINSALGDIFEIAVTNNSAFQINNPINAPGPAQKLIIRVKNTSGGPMGLITWDTQYKMAAWTNPATGFSRSTEFYNDGTNWIQVWQSAADVPN